MLFFTFFFVVLFLFISKNEERERGESKNFFLNFLHNLHFIILMFYYDYYDWGITIMFLLDYIALTHNNNNNNKNACFGAACKKATAVSATNILNIHTHTLINIFYIRRKKTSTLRSLRFIKLLHYYNFIILEFVSLSLSIFFISSLSFRVSLFFLVSFSIQTN